MSLPYNRIYNLSAGPAMLPTEVLEHCREDLLNYKGTGMSLMEMSHRSKPFEDVIHQAEADLRALLAIPAGYKVLFLQGGASLQFSNIPICFLPSGQTAEYVITGAWGKKALESAALVGETHVCFDGKSGGYKAVPDLSQVEIDPNAAYVHFTTNETIQGVEFHSDPTTKAPLICDMSSDILSRPVDVSKYSVIYAGAQKNMGPAGLTVVIVSDEMLAKVPQKMHPMLDYRLQAENESLYNTPPAWSIYVTGLVYKHLVSHGGLTNTAKQNRAKADVLYRAIDSSGGFYKGHAEPGSRSVMNVTFTLPDEEVTNEFIKLAEASQFSGLKGHRSVGGCRASIYNAFPLDGCTHLAQFMGDFAKKKG